MVELVERARREPAFAARCLIALRKGDDPMREFVGAFLVADFISLIREFLGKE